MNKPSPLPVGSPQQGSALARHTESTGRNEDLARDVKDFIAGIVEMTEGNADIDKRSIIKPGVTIRREAKRLLGLLNEQ